MLCNYNVFCYEIMFFYCFGCLSHVLVVCWWYEEGKLTSHSENGGFLHENVYLGLFFPKVKFFPLK